MREYLVYRARRSNFPQHRVDALADSSVGGSVQETNPYETILDLRLSLSKIGQVFKNMGYDAELASSDNGKDIVEKIGQLKTDYDHMKTQLEDRQTRIQSLENKIHSEMEKVNRRDSDIEKLRGRLLLKGVTDFSFMTPQEEPR